MRTATSLTLMAIGAILAFAITSQPSFLNLHVAGAVLIVIGAVGLVLPGGRLGWLRRRVTFRRAGPRSPVERVEEERQVDETDSSYAMLDPAALGRVRPRWRRVRSRWPGPAGPGTAQEEQVETSVYENVYENEE